MTALEDLRTRAPLRLVAYIIISVAACTADAIVTLSLTWRGVPPVLAAAVGYIVGMGAHWALSIRFVFAPELCDDGVARRRQVALFLSSGLVGLWVTASAYAGAMALGASPLPSKLVAVGLSFIVVYLFRRHVVFAARA